MKLRLFWLEGIHLRMNPAFDWRTRCSEFLESLFEYQHSCIHVFRILLSTSGQSGVLQDHVNTADIVFAQAGAREAIKGGEWVGNGDD
jgi:hypothetical protein